MTTENISQVGLKFKTKKPSLVLRQKAKKEDLESLEDFNLREKQLQEKQLIYRKREDDLLKLQNLLGSIFDENEWDSSKVGEQHFIYKHKQHKNNVVEIHQYKEKIKFSGNPIEKVIELANNYEKAFGEMEYEVEASDLDTAKEFIASLNQHGFEINKIKHLKLKTNEQCDLNKIVNDIKKSKPTPYN